MSCFGQWTSSASCVTACPLPPCLPGRSGTAAASNPHPVPPAPAAGGAGGGASQAGHHDGAARHHRGTWTPQSASHRVYSPFIPFIYHNQRWTLTLAGLKEWQPQGSGLSQHLMGLDPPRDLSLWLPGCLSGPKLKGCPTRPDPPRNSSAPSFPGFRCLPILRGGVDSGITLEANLISPTSPGACPLTGKGLPFFGHLGSELSLLCCDVKRAVAFGSGPCCPMR